MTFVSLLLALGLVGGFPLLSVSANRKPSPGQDPGYRSDSVEVGSVSPAQAAPTVTQFYPVASTPGATIVVTGTGFVAGSTQVFFGATRLIPAAEVTVVTPNLLQVVVPPSGVQGNNINGFLTVRVNGVDVTTQALPTLTPDPSLPNAVYPEFVLWGDAGGDGAFQTADITLIRAFILFQVNPTSRQLLASNVTPLNANGSRGDNLAIGTNDFTLIRAVSFGQATFTSLIPPTVQIKVDNPLPIEGNSSNSAVNVTLERLGNTAASQAVTLQTVDGTATAGSDYVGMLPTPVSFAPTEVSKSIALNLIGDTLGERPETFQVNCTSTLRGGPVMVPPGQVTVTITPDDPYLWVDTTDFIADFGSQSVGNFSGWQNFGLNGVALTPNQFLNRTALTHFELVPVTGLNTPQTDANGNLAVIFKVRFRPQSVGTFTEILTWQLQGSSSPDTRASLPPLRGIGTANRVPSVIAEAPPAAMVGTPYSQTLTINGSESNYQVSLGSGALPEGLSMGFHSNGSMATISGTPTRAGTATFTLRVEGPSGDTTEHPFQIRVLSVPCQALTLTQANLPSGRVGEPYPVQTFSQSGETGSISWSLTGVLPKGMTFNPELATLEGIPQSGQAGIYPITIIARQTNGCLDSFTFTLKIKGYKLGSRGGNSTDPTNRVAIAP